MRTHTQSASCSRSRPPNTAHMAPCRRRRRPTIGTMQQRPTSCACSRHEQGSGDLQTAQEQPSSTAPAVVLPAAGRSARSPENLAAFAAVLVAAGVLCYSQLSSRDLPEVSLQLVGRLLLAALAVPTLGIATLKLLLKDLFHVELHRGRLYFTAGVPSTGPPLQPGAVVVRPTTDGRGNGAFATMPIAKGTHMIDYEGEALDRRAFFERYPSGEGDYAMAVDDEWVLDAADLVNKTDTFSGVHMNHSRRGANVGRFYRRAERHVAFFALRDIAAGEELLFDYGRDYWRGREHLLIGDA